MKKSNPADVVFKDIAEFDMQNPIIGTLLNTTTIWEKKE